MIHISDNNLRILKKLEGESFKFLTPITQSLSGLNDVIRIDYFDPTDFVGIPYKLAKDKFLGVVIRNRRYGTVALAKLGRYLVGDPIKIVTKDQIECLCKSNNPSERRLAKMASTDPVSFLKWC